MEKSCKSHGILLRQFCGNPAYIPYQGWIVRKSTVGPVLLERNNDICIIILETECTQNPIAMNAILNLF